MPRRGICVKALQARLLAACRHPVQEQRQQRRQRLQGLGTNAQDHVEDWNVTADLGLCGADDDKLTRYSLHVISRITRKRGLHHQFSLLKH